jgi:3-methylcrotonyl-CoA carboxylase alpha subunit
LELPGDVRVDRGVEAGSKVTPYYDAMIAKLIAQAPTREAALDRLAHALDRTLIVGPRSNVAFLADLCRTSEFRQGGVDTGFIDRNLAALAAVPHGIDRAAAALGVLRLVTSKLVRELPEDGSAADDDTSQAQSPWAARDGFQLGGSRLITVPVVIDGESAMATISYGRSGTRIAIEGTAPATDAGVFETGEDAYVLRHGRQTRVRIKDPAGAAAETGAGDGVIKAPMHGRVVEILAGVGDRVAGGQRLAVIEAMKMEHTLRAPFAGIVRQVSVGGGAQVVEGAEIMVIGRLGDA